MQLKEYIKQHPRLAYYLYSLRPWRWRPSSVDQSVILSKFAQVYPDVFFLQIGSNDGVGGDPLNLLIKQYGWNGILVEPLPEVFRRLEKNYAGFRGLVFENSAISEKAGELDFFTLVPAGGEVHASQLSSFVYDVIAKQKSVMPDFDDRLQIRKVSAITFSELLEKHQVHKVDLLHIDTEGYDFQILKMVNFGKIRPPIILYESEHLSPADYKNSIKLLKEHGYRIFFRDGHDTLAMLNRDFL